MKKLGPPEVPFLVCDSKESLVSHMNELCKKPVERGKITDKIVSALSQAYAAGIGEGSCRKHLELDPQGFWNSLGVTDKEIMNFYEQDFFQFLKATRIMDQFEDEDNK